MSARRFFEIYQDAVRKGIFKDKSIQSMRMVSDYVRKIQRDPSQVMKMEKDSLLNNTRNIGLGKMYLYFYDPKWKKELPYYDRFPCTVPMNFYEDGFLGLNLHYLPYMERAVLLGNLYELENKTNLSERKRFKITYGIIKDASKWKRAKPCIKRYLYTHFRSKPLRVDYFNWPIAAFLPLATWEKASPQKVWSDSRKIMKK